MRRWTGGMQPPERGQQGAPHAEEDRGLHALPPSAGESRPPAFWSRISSAQNGEKNFGRRSHAVRDTVAAPSGHDRAEESRLVRPAWAAWESRMPCPWGGGAHGKPTSPAAPCRPLPPPAAEDGQQGARGHGATAWGGVSPVLTGAEHSTARGVEPSPVDAGAVPGGHAHVVLGPKPRPSPSNLSPVRPPPQTPCTRLPHTSVPSHACRCGGARTPNLWEKKTVPNCQTPMKSANVVTKSAISTAISTFSSTR